MRIQAICRVMLLFAPCLVASANADSQCPTDIVGWGNNDGTQATPPSQVNDVVAVAGGWYHSLGLRRDGTVAGWGGSTAASVPGGLSNVIAVAAGAYHSVALKSNGTVVAWGDWVYGETNIPPGLAGVTAIAAGGYHSLALKSDGSAVSWGDSGQFTPAVAASNIVAVAAGFYHSLALKADGTVVGWGDNSSGQTNPPPGLTGVIAIAAGNGFSLALKNTGIVVGWGAAAPATPPVSLSNVTAIAAGGGHSLALKSDGTVVAWGDNTDGRATPPVRLVGVFAIAAGYSHSLAVACTPITLTAVPASASQIDFAWTPSPTNETGYKIEWTYDNGGGPGVWSQIGQVGSLTTSSGRGGLPASSKWWFRVRGFNAVGNSLYSNVATATTAAVSLPDNSWISLGSDNWQAGINWSAALPPNQTQSATYITNANTKVVTIDATTSVNFPSTLTISNLTIAGLTGSTNTLSLVAVGATPLRILQSFSELSGGALSISNSTVLVDVTAAGSTNLLDGSVNIIGGGAFIATNATTLVGSTSGANGFVDIRAGNLICSNLLIGASTNAIGKIGIVNGQLIVTNLTLTLGRFGQGTLTASNSTVRVRTFNIANGAGSTGTLTLVNSTNTVSMLMTVGIGSGATGAVWVVDSSVLSNGTSGINIGFSGDGTLNVSNSTMFSRGLDIAPISGRGTAAFVGSSITSDGNFAIGSGATSTGAVTISGGQLNASTNNFIVGSFGVGELVASNCSMQGGNTYVALGGTGTLTLQSAGLTASLGTYIGYVGTGSVWMSGNSIFTMSRETYLGYGGVGQLVLSNGMLMASNLLVSVAAPNRGTLTVLGGSASVSTSLIIGDCVSNGLGRVTVMGGLLAVTNAAHTAVLDVRGGTFTMAGGTLIVDTLAITNACGRFVRSGGNIIYNALVIDPNLSAVGDGIPNGWKQQYGLDPFDTNIGGADNDGDGFTNLQEFQAGSNPTNSASFFGVTGTATEGDNIRVTWATAAGKTNALERSATVTTNFAGIFTVTNTTGSVTNYLDLGAATNSPSWFYRVRLVP